VQTTMKSHRRRWYHTWKLKISK